MTPEQREQYQQQHRDAQQQYVASMTPEQREQYQQQHRDAQQQYVASMTPEQREQYQQQHCNAQQQHFKSISIQAQEAIRTRHAEQQRERFQLLSDAERAYLLERRRLIGAQRMDGMTYMERECFLQHIRDRQRAAYQTRVTAMTRPLYEELDAMIADPGRMPSAQLLDGLYQMEPLVAQLKFALNSGFNVNEDKMQVDDNLDPSSAVHDDGFENSQDGGSTQPAPRYSAPVSDVSKYQCVSAYLDAMDPTTTLHACASCGIRRQPQWPAFLHVPLDACDVLRLVDAEVQEYLSSPRREFRTVYQHQRGGVTAAYYYVHEKLLELVDDPSDPTSDPVLNTVLCDGCHRTVTKGPTPTIKKLLLDTAAIPLTDTVRRARLLRPKYNIGNGYDFGTVPESFSAVFSCMSRAELSATATVENFMTCIKIKNTAVKGVKGHIISFGHDGSLAVAKELPRRDLHENMTAAFIGSTEDWKLLQDSSLKRSGLFRKYPQLSINVSRVYEYLRIKKIIDPLNYGSITINNGDDVVRELETLAERVIDAALVSSDPVAMKVEGETCDDTSRQQQHGDAVDDDGSAISMDSVFVSKPVQQLVLEPVHVLRAVQRTIASAKEGLERIEDPVEADLMHNRVDECTNEIPSGCPTLRFACNYKIG